MTPVKYLISEILADTGLSKAVISVANTTATHSMLSTADIPPNKDNKVH